MVRPITLMDTSHSGVAWEMSRASKCVSRADTKRPSRTIRNDASTLLNNVHATAAASHSARVKTRRLSLKLRDDVLAAYDPRRPGLSDPVARNEIEGHSVYDVERATVQTHN